MLEFLKNFFVSNECNQCKHTFDQWKETKRLQSQYGEVKIIQERQCTTCGFKEFHSKYY